MRHEAHSLVNIMHFRRETSNERFLQPKEIVQRRDDAGLFFTHRGLCRAVVWKWLLG